MTHPIKRTLLILACGGALCAYATAAGAQFKPNFPIRLEEAPDTSPPEADDAPVSTAAPEAAPRAMAVQSKPLAPLPAAARRVQPDDDGGGQPASRTVVERSVTGKVVEVEGKARTYEVKRGDTLSGIAEKLGTTVSQLRKDNGIKGSTIRPGQDLKGPKTKAKAYVVESGDTLSAIGRRFGVSVSDIAAENDDLSRSDTIHPGDKLRLPAGYRDKGPITTTTRVPVETAPPRPEPARPEPSRPEPSRPTGRTPEPREEAPAEAGGTRRLATGRVTDVEGPPARYTVRRGDNLEVIAGRLDTTVTALKRDNGLKSSVIHPGQVLKGPPTSVKAYVAVAGDTLADVARRFGVSADALRRANGLARNASLRAGQALRLPSGYRDRGPVTVTTPAPSRTEAPPPRREEPAPALPSRPQPYVPSGRTPAPPPRTSAPPAAPVASPPPTDASISAMGRGRFIWPVRGDLLSEFGVKSVGQRNDGINIRVAAGQTVRAAASGEVVYAGDQVPGFGNLVLLKHEDGWVTAYGHLGRIDVKMQQQVTQGQQIGQTGATGGVAEPQLHFEVRYAPSPLDRAKPIDPTLVLPR